MNWTLTGLLIETAAGVFGAHFAAAVGSDYRFGWFGHSIAGAVGGLSGYLLQTITGVTVTTGSAFNEPSQLEQIAVHSLAGATAGAILTLAVGFLKHSIDADRSSKP